MTRSRVPDRSAAKRDHPPRFPHVCSSSSSATRPSSSRAGMHCNYCRGRTKRLGDMAYQRGREKEEAKKVLTCLYSIMNSSFHNAVYCCMPAGLLYCTVVSDEETPKRAANSHLFSVDMYGPRGWTYFFLFSFSPLPRYYSQRSISQRVGDEAGWLLLPPAPSPSTPSPVDPSSEGFTTPKATTLTWESI